MSALFPVIEHSCHELSPSQFERVLVLAIQGDRETLRGLAGDQGLMVVDPIHRLGPAIYLRLRRAGLIQLEALAWRSSFLKTVATHLVLQATLSKVSEALGAIRVPWAPIKGGDISSRVYDHREERPLVDLDVLISRKNYLVARQALEQRGFVSLEGGARADQFVLDEGHCWHARSPDGMLLELHTRFWGWIPEGLAEEVMVAARPDSSFGQTGRRISLPHAFVIAALHAWTIPVPRPLLCWWDLARIAEAGDENFSETVVELAMRWDIQLPVGLASSRAAGLWPDAGCGAIARALLQRVKTPEHFLVRQPQRRDSDAISLEQMCLARLIARRPSRQGWRLVWRRLWAHPGVVEQATQANWSWWVRRTAHVLKGAGFIPVQQARAKPMNEKVVLQSAG